MSAYGGLDCTPIVTVYRTVISCETYSLEEVFEFCCHSFTEELEKKKHQLEQIYIIIIIIIIYFLLGAN